MNITFNNIFLNIIIIMNIIINMITIVLKIIIIGINILFTNNNIDQKVNVGMYKVYLIPKRLWLKISLTFVNDVNIRLINNKL